jgi:hypothetical protein
MSHYRLEHIDLSTRIELGMQMLAPSRSWGQVSTLAKKYGVSRKFLYQLNTTMREALEAALQAKPAGRKPKVESVMIDQAFLNRAMLVLATVVPGTVRTIQLVLELLFDEHKSIGVISETLQAFGEAAQDYNATLRTALPMLGEADEIFQGKQPCLTVVDGRSFLVLNLSAEQSRDATTWGVTLLELLERGFQFHDLSSDGAKGITAGMRDAKLDAPHRPDLFHLLRKGHRITRRLETDACQAMERTEKAHRAQLKASSSRCRTKSGRMSYAKAQAKEQQAIELFDCWEWLFGEIRYALRPFNAEGECQTVTQARHTIETAVELLSELGSGKVKAFAQRQILKHLDELLAPLAWLEQSLALQAEHLDSKTMAFIVWAWMHQRQLEITVDDLDPSLHKAAQTIWSTLDLFHRASSLSESLHSWLRPHLQVHRGMPDWLLPLLQLFWNHHPFQRGKRKGKSPVQWADVEQACSLSQVLDRLIHSQLSEQAIV